VLSWNLWSALVAVPSFAMKRIALPVLRFPTSNVSTSLEFSFYRDEGPSVADVVKVLVAYPRLHFLFSSDSMDCERVQITTQPQDTTHNFY